MNIKKYVAPDGALFLSLMKLQLCHAYGAKDEVMEKIFRLLKLVLTLVVVAFCFFGYALHYESGIFREFQAALLSAQWMLLACIVVWCVAFLFLTFSLKDLPLIGLLLIAIAAYFIGYMAASREPDAIILFAGVTLGRGARFFLRQSLTWPAATLSHPMGEGRGEGNFLIGLVVLLAFSSWWHLDMSGNFYHGPRWMGLWNNPNIYGMLMSVGLVLAVGLLAAKRHKGYKGNQENSNSSPRPSPRQTRRGWNFLRSLRSFAAIDSIILFIAAGMMAIGLLFSYSRGAWLGTAIGLLYLAKIYGKLKWRFVLPAIVVVAAVVCFFWNATPDTAPWYVKRMDFGRPSAQHRVSAWRGAIQMMRDHPFGVGWNKAVNVYDKNYSPPEGGAAAITMNSYLMLGTELGIPALICFVAYVALRLGVGRWKIGARKKEMPKESARADQPSLKSFGMASARPTATLGATQVACRAGALALLVAFWFDGGLFDLPTASVFWVLLELDSAPISNRKPDVPSV